MSYRNPVRSVGVVGTVTTVTSGGGGTTPAAWALRGSTLVAPSSTTNKNVTTPAETKAGDLLLLFVQSKNGANAPAVNEDTAWTKCDQNTYSQGVSYALYWRRATATDAAGGATYSTVSFGGVSNQAMMVALACPLTAPAYQSLGTSVGAASTSDITQGTGAAWTGERLQVFALTTSSTQPLVDPAINNLPKFLRSNEPPAPQPTWINVVGSGGFMVLGVVPISSPAASITLALSRPNSVPFIATAGTFA